MELPDLPVSKSPDDMIRLGVVFDFDGVLADTELLHLRAYQQVLDRRGWTLDRTAYFERYLGYNDEEMLRLFADDHRLDLDDAALRGLIEEKTTAYQSVIASGTVLYPGAAACVRRLALRFPLAIASGSLRDEILTILHGEGLSSVFSTVVSANDVARSKPAPDPYLKAAAGLGLDPRHCVAIEDSHWGLTSARTAGMRTIALTTSSPAARLVEANVMLERVDQVTIDIVLGVFEQAAI